VLPEKPARRALSQTGWWPSRLISEQEIGPGKTAKSQQTYRSIIPPPQWTSRDWSTRESLIERLKSIELV
jgi:hypothetical protein